MTSRLRRLAVTLLVRLGILSHPPAGTGPEPSMPPVVPLIAGAFELPAVLPGLPGDWTPQTGCVP
jgi:hypothetical protein